MLKLFDKKWETVLKCQDIPAIKDKKWKDFFLIDIFPDIKRGKRLKREDHIAGKFLVTKSSESTKAIYFPLQFCNPKLRAEETPSFFL